MLVYAFLNKKINKNQITKGIQKMLDEHNQMELNTVEEILALDKEVKEKTRKMIED